ncbi:MAG: iron-containing alcohol dehydrogenase [Gemmobacter sp.]
MSFAIIPPGRVHLGPGEARRAPTLAQGFGARGIVVHGASGARAAWLLDALARAGLAAEALGCPSEPTLDMLEAGLRAARPHRPDWVIAIGGGAALDLGKALAALIPAAGGPLDHLEVVGRGLPLGADPLPLIAIPTTAGTGSEATRNAVIGLPDHGRKVSLRDDRMMPRIALVDPELMAGCPPAVTLASGLDAIVQLIEPLIGRRATPFSDALARAALGPALAALKRLTEAEDPAARATMAWAALAGGIALTNGGLGAVHGLAGVIGGRSGGAHGAICGTLLGPVLEMNRALGGAATIARIDEVCAAIAATFGGAATDAPRTLADWARAQGLPDLGALGLDRSDLAGVARDALGSSSMQGNPVMPDEAALCAAMAAA